MNRTHRLLAIAFSLLLSFAAGAGSQEVRPGDIDPATVVRQLPDMPARGASMAQVEARLGLPEQRYPAVGEPPITRWVYPDFTVYFEHNRVIHSVKRRR